MSSRCDDVLRFIIKLFDYGIVFSNRDSLFIRWIDLVLRLNVSEEVLQIQFNYTINPVHDEKLHRLYHLCTDYFPEKSNHHMLVLHGQRIRPPLAILIHYRRLLLTHWVFLSPPLVNARQRLSERCHFSQ